MSALTTSPHIVSTRSVTQIMLKVLLALIPGIVTYVWYFGTAILISLTLTTIATVTFEAVMLRLRGAPMRLFLRDLSAVVTAWLLALSIPPLAPWWLYVVGAGFAIIIGKQVYGGLGNNPFNPAMLGYAVLIISFPAHMTPWPTLSGLDSSLSFIDTLRYVFAGHLPAGMNLDAITMATPLDTLKTQLHLQRTLEEIATTPIFGKIGGRGSEVIAVAYLLGGLYLLQQRIISWRTPVAYLLTIFLTASMLFGYDSSRYASPWFHLFTGGVMLGAFFIVTDPVSGATTPNGKLIFAAGAGFLAYVIRVFGGYPDGVAFGVLIMNMAAPLIDAYTQPRVFGYKKKSN